MKRILSLFLLIPFMTVQAWALRGGPFDSLYSRSQGAMSGAYGVVLSGNVLDSKTDAQGNQLKDAQGNKVKSSINPETTGIMTMAVPSSGLASGRILIFAQGLMYLGSSQGVVDQRSGRVTLLSQVSHYVSRVATNGLEQQSGVFVDAVLNGKMDLQLSLDWFSGLIEVTGKADYYKFDTLLTQVVQNTNTQAGVNNAVKNLNMTENQTANSNLASGTASVGSQTKNQTSAASNTSSDTTTQTAQQDASAGKTATTTGPTLTSTTTTISNSIDADGSAISNNSSVSNSSTATDVTASNTRADSNKATNSGTTQASTVDGGSSSSAIKNETTDQTKGSSLIAGTVTTSGTAQTSTDSITTTKFQTETVQQKPTAVSFMSLAATGIRSDSVVPLISPFAPPSEATGFQVDVPVTTNGGGGAPRPPGQ